MSNPFNRALDKAKKVKDGESFSEHAKKAINSIPSVLRRDKGKKK